jgi:hypothetical protein
MVSRSDGGDLGPRAQLLLCVLTVHQGPIRVQLSLDRPLPVNATLQLPQALQAKASGSVDASVDGEVDAAITELIQHERILIGL